MATGFAKRTPRHIHRRRRRCTLQNGLKNQLKVTESAAGSQGMG